MTTQKTRCPYCSSVFAVSNAQLAIRDGYTRCGKCFQVFKADDYLIQVRGTEPTSEKNSAEMQPKNSAHIVDLHKISPTKNKGFNTALDHFLDSVTHQPQPPEEQTVEQTSIDYDQIQTEKVSLSVIPNLQPAPETRIAESLLVVTPITEQTPLIPQSFGQEFNEQWLNETNPTVSDTHSHAINKTSTATTEDNTVPETPAPKIAIPVTTISKAPNKDSQVIDDDLMGYLNKNSVASATKIKVKTGRILPGMNDFHANQRSKKKDQPLPMHFQTTKRNVALDRLNKRKSFFNIKTFFTIGWLIVSLLMVVLLAAQYVFFNFDQLAANPRYQPIMHKACLQLGCDVPLIDISKIKINKVLARSFPANPTGATKFTATMTNSADESQPFPSIRLIVLKDKQVLSGRNLRPSEYLTRGYNSQLRIVPHHPVQIEFVVKISRDDIPVFALDPIR